MERRTLIKVTAVVLVAGVLPRARASAAAKYRIGFSQATILETWRVQFNKDMRKEAEKHPEIELIIADGQNKTEKQVADVENFISQGVDVLLISPKESAGLTPVTLKAIEAGIPVIILDRNVNTDKITQFIGGDNTVIGQVAGEHAVKLLGGKGAAKGNVVELWGGFASAPAHDRSTGFHAITDKEPGIKSLLAPIDTEWKSAKGYEIMATALQANERIDLVYAHNDPLAYNAYLAAKDAGREKDIKFLGIDGIPGEGVTWVDKGQLSATFLYATPGAEGIRQALRLMKGEKIEKQITLPTMTITKENAAEIIKANS